MYRDKPQLVVGAALAATLTTVLFAHLVVLWQTGSAVCGVHLSHCGIMLSPLFWPVASIIASAVAVFILEYFKVPQFGWIVAFGWLQMLVLSWPHNYFLDDVAHVVLAALLVGATYRATHFWWNGWRASGMAKFFASLGVPAVSALMLHLLLH